MRSRGQKSLWRRLVDWLNEERPPAFSLDPNYPGPLPSEPGVRCPAGESESHSRDGMDRSQEGRGAKAGSPARVEIRRRKREEEPKSKGFPGVPGRVAGRLGRAFAASFTLRRKKKDAGGSDEPAGGSDERRNGSSEGGSPASQRKSSRQFTANFDANLRQMRTVLHADKSSDVIIRRFRLPAGKGLRAALVYIDALIDRRTVNVDILRPLSYASAEMAARMSRAVADDRIEDLLPSASVRREKSVDKAAEEILLGAVALLIEGISSAVLVDAKGWEKRSVSIPQVERVVRGPHQAFVEALEVNVALVRRMVRTPDLVCEYLEIGEMSKTQVAILYIEGVTNRKLVDEVKRRIACVKGSEIIESGMLDQFLDEPRFNLIPSTASTERPDRIAAHLAEGHVAVIVDHSPFALVIPCTVTVFVHNPEDFYVRWPYGTFLRLIRLLGTFIAMVLPAFYVAAINFHPEMIPSVLLWAIASSREVVPTPLVAEVLAGEIAFDFIREAGVRVPSPIGPTIGIVGALLVGEAAVRASLLSPVVVIVIAITAISSFTIPNQEATFMVRIMRYVFIAVGASFGLLGIGLVLYAFGVYLCWVRNFGVLFMSPFAFSARAGPDIVTRGPLWRMETRPAFLRVEDARRQPWIARQWIPRPRRGLERHATIRPTRDES